MEYFFTDYLFGVTYPAHIQTQSACHPVKALSSPCGTNCLSGNEIDGVRLSMDHLGHPLKRVSHVTEKVGWTSRNCRIISLFLPSPFARRIQTDRLKATTPDPSRSSYDTKLRRRAQKPISLSLRIPPNIYKTPHASYSGSLRNSAPDCIALAHYSALYPEVPNFCSPPIH